MVGFAAADTFWETALQRAVPSDRLGRVASFDRLGSSCLRPFGYLLAGSAAIAFGLSATLRGASVALLVTVLAVALLVPAMRRLVPRPPGVTEFGARSSKLTTGHQTARQQLRRSSHGYATHSAAGWRVLGRPGHLDRRSSARRHRSGPAEGLFRADRERRLRRIHRSLQHRFRATAQFFPDAGGILPWALHRTAGSSAGRPGRQARGSEP